MKISAEIKLKLDLKKSISNIQHLEKTANRAMEAVNEFNLALERCKKIDMEISIIHKKSSKKWWQFWKVKIGKSRANTFREYTSNPMAKAVIPPSAFMEFFLGFTAEQIELVNAIRDKEMEEEVSKMKDVKDTLGGELQNAPQEKDKTKEQRGEPPKKRELPDASV